VARQRSSFGLQKKRATAKILNTPNKQPHLHEEKGVFKLQWDKSAAK
jgi:hypothetical protein